jgi:hypothetical protein
MLDQHPPHAPAVREIARWTHAWMCAAATILHGLEAAWDDESPAASVGTRDALTLVLVDAVRNTYRGAAAVLGSDHSAVQTFEQAVPGLKDLRDSLEHFDAYLRGTGHRQPALAGPDAQADQGAPMAVVDSAGGGPQGHTVQVAVREKTGTQTYQFATGTAVSAARTLARTALEHVGLYNEHHAAACRHCPA